MTSNGEIVIRDGGSPKIRRVDRNGIITVIAGNGVGGYGGDGGSALNAIVNFEGEIVMTDSGDVLIADTYNHRIRRVYSNGTIVAIAGNGNSGYTGDGSPAILAALSQPRSVAYLDGEVYLADTQNNRLRKIFVNGTITTIAGNGTSGHCGDGHFAIDACVNRPVSVVVNDAGEVFFSDEQNHVVRKIDVDSVISTYAGTPGSGGYDGDGGLATEAKLNSPRGLAINHEGELLIADSDNNVIRKVYLNGTISTVVDTLSKPVAVAVGRDGEVFIVEGNKYQMTKVDNNELRMIISGDSVAGGSADFYLPENAPLVFVSSVSVLSDEVLIVADTYNHRIKKVEMSAKSIVPLADHGEFNPPLSYPRGTTIVNNEVYFADYGNHCIRKIDLNNGGLISDVVGVCGIGGYSVDGTQASSALLLYPSSVVVDSHGDMFIADSGNHIVRKVSGGIITTIAGKVGQAMFSENNVLALSTHLYEPTDLAIAPNGELFISDYGNHCIRKIDASDKIQIVAGKCGMNEFSGDDGLATSALLSHPRGLAFTLSW